MKEIKIKYVDFWPGFRIEEDLIYEILLKQSEYQVVISDEPDYVIYSCFGKEHLNYDCIRIFFTGEDISPDFNICDYGIGFDYLSFDDRFFRLPLMYEPLYKKDYDFMMNRHYSLQEKRDFCSFVYSNSEADPYRNEFFLALSQYKPIASGGRIMNNTGGPIADKQEFESGYKFSLAFENVQHNGYITEKLMQSFAAGGVPIYWGDPYVTRMFNKNAFININEFSSIEEAIKYIIKIDNDDEAYKAMLSQPPLLEDYFLENITERYSQFILNIFDQNLTDAKRTSRKAANKNYYNNIKMKEKTFQIISPLIRIGKKIQHIGEKIKKV